MNRTLWILASSILIVVGLFYFLSKTDQPQKLEGNQPLVVYCAASNRKAMEAVREDYEREYKRKVQVQYGPSQTLLSSIEVGGQCDLYLPADDSFLHQAKDKGVLEEVLPIGQMKGIVAVRKGNPLKIERWEDLLRSDVRVVQANPDAAAIAKLTRETLESSGQWEPLHQKTASYRMTVTDAASDVVIGAADAAIVYDVVIDGMKELEPVAIKELAPVVSQVSIGVISKTKQPQAALHFSRYLTAKDKGLKRYQEHGFGVTEGDLWSESPRLTIYAGSMLRPAIEETIAAFEAREGITIDRVYNGCGILVAQMKAGNHPDAYFACDSEFMKAVPELFPEPVDVSSNRLVILVKKGNPHAIQSLRDLTNPGLRIGIGHEKQCAMGWLTQNTLRESGVQQEVMKNVVVQTPTGDMLVNQLLAGSLDAGVVYISNAAGKGDLLDAIAIDGLPCSIATQPFAIAKDSKYSQIVARLFAKLRSAESRESFEAEGFSWKLESEEDK